MNKDQLNPTTIYQLFAEADFRKYFHFGGLQATRLLLDLCRVNSGTFVLDIGCASGKTACYTANIFGSRVIGVDNLEPMIKRADERAQREGVNKRVSFQIADAAALPFADNLFDVVIGEFITGLLGEKSKAASEYLRVVKPGGYIGLNEATWIESPPPSGLVEY